MIFPTEEFRFIENGGFSAAVRALGVSKSAVSKRINQLESHLGMRLLHRTTRRLSLTEAGERYYEHVIQALSAAGLVSISPQSRHSTRKPAPGKNCHTE
jgi:DNA-binding transcriptional LysR family regulator